MRCEYFSLQSTKTHVKDKQQCRKQMPIKMNTQPFYGHHAGRPVNKQPELRTSGLLLDLSFTASMPLLPTIPSIQVKIKQFVLEAPAP